ncbi:MAG: hypothetical protein KDC88_14125 [Ignavibacteriae bacterium]|nr:hypothetical protein [Ignavibacteriota bacterium]
MTKEFKISTGFSFLDQKWGGIYKGGNYFIFGSKKAGKTVLALKIIENLVQSNYNILLFTSERKKSLEIQASSIYFDINDAVSKGILTIEKYDDELNNFDEVKQKIEKVNPAILVIDEITNQKFEINNNYIDFIEFLENSDISTFLVASVPQNENSKSLVKKVAKYSTGIIQLQKSAQRNYSGTIAIKPNIGHFEGEFETTYKVEPVKGLITLSDNENLILGLFSESKSKRIFKETKNFDYSNIYSIDEFKFLMESYKSFTKQTGSKVNILSIELLNERHSSAEVCNEFRNVLSEGDKISFTDNMIYILPEKSDKIKIEELSGELDRILNELFDSSDSVENNFIKRIQLLNQNFKIV